MELIDISKLTLKEFKGTFGLIVNGYLDMRKLCAKWV